MKLTINLRCYFAITFSIETNNISVEEKELQFRLWSLTIIFPEILTIDFLSRCNREFFRDGTWLQDWKV